MPLDNFGPVITRLDNGSVRLVTRSAQPADDEGAGALTAIGVKTVIKLCSEREFALAKEQSMLPFSRVVPDPLAGLFRIGDTNAVIRIAAQIDVALGVGGVHVHCTHGRDRTGLVCAAFRLIYDHASLDQVNAERRAYGVDGIIALFDIPDNEILEEIDARVKSGTISKTP